MNLALQLSPSFRSLAGDFKSVSSSDSRACDIAIDPDKRLSPSGILGSRSSFSFHTLEDVDYRKTTDNETNLFSVDPNRFHQQYPSTLFVEGKPAWIFVPPKTLHVELRGDWSNELRELSRRGGQLLADLYDARIASALPLVDIVRDPREHRYWAKRGDATDSDVEMARKQSEQAKREVSLLAATKVVFPRQNFALPDDVAWWLFVHRLAWKTPLGLGYFAGPFRRGKMASYNERTGKLSLPSSDAIRELLNDGQAVADRIIADLRQTSPLYSTLGEESPTDPKVVGSLASEWLSRWLEKIAAETESRKAGSSFVSPVSTRTAGTASADPAAIRSRITALCEAIDAGRDLRPLANEADQLFLLVGSIDRHTRWRDAHGKPGEYSSTQLHPTDPATIRRNAVISELGRCLSDIAKGMRNIDTTKRIRHLTAELLGEDWPADKPETQPSPTKATVTPSKPLPPSRQKVLAAYSWAISEIPGAENMTYAELLQTIKDRLEQLSLQMRGADNAAKFDEWVQALPNNAGTFGRYLRGAGVNKNQTRGDRPHGGRSIRKQRDI